MQADKLDEQWTPTTVHTTFVLPQLPSCTARSPRFSIELPLLNLGWAFVLSLAPERTQPAGGGKKGSKYRASTQATQSYKWISAAFSFHRRDSNVPWGNTYMHAQLSLTTESAVGSVFGFTTTGTATTSSDSTSLGPIIAVLAQTPSVELPLTTSYKLSSQQRITLTLTISECPFANGLFGAISANHGSETEAKTLQLVRQSSDRVLSQSLATGKLFDIKFLSFSTPGKPGKFLPTYTSLFVLEEHLNHSDCKLKDGWASALATLNDHDNADINRVVEVSCPDGYEYEFDSDYEDEDYPSSLGDSPDALSLPSESNATTTLKGKQREDSGARSSSSWSSVEADGVGSQSVDGLLEDVIKGPGNPSHLILEATGDYERTILIKFAAHRTRHAFLWYCYTGDVTFNKLKSQVQPGTRHPCVTHPEDGPPSCSPKSMYRLADLVGDKDLKTRTLQGIKKRLTAANVLDETFSFFTSKYPDVREVQFSVLMEHCGSPEVKKAFLKAMQKYSEMSHAEPVLSAFYDELVA